MGDLRHLDVLNRKQRQAYKKQMEGKETMLVKLNVDIEAYDVDETLIKNEKGDMPTLKKLLMRSLRQVHADDQKDNLQMKQIRYNLLKRIDKADEIDLTDSERELLCNRVGKIFLQCELVGKTCDLINAVVEEKAVEAKDAAPTQIVSTEIPPKQ